MGLFGYTVFYSAHNDRTVTDSMLSCVRIPMSWNLYGFGGKRTNGGTQISYFFIEVPLDTS